MASIAESCHSTLTVSIVRSIASLLAQFFRGETRPARYRHLSQALYLASQQ